jgi:hypothetical protein
MTARTGRRGGAAHSESHQRCREFGERKRSQVE